MKTLKTLIPCIILMMALGTANVRATGNGDDDRLSLNYAVNIYVDAISYGHIKGLSQILDDNLKYTVARGSGNMVFNKTDLLDFFKELKDVRQDCLVSTITDDKTPDVTILKIYMKYRITTRVNYITMVNSATGWKITNIYSEMLK